MTSSELSRLASVESSISSVKNDISSMKGFGWSSFDRDLADIDDCLDDIDYYLSYSLGGGFGRPGGGVLELVGAVAEW